LADPTREQVHQLLARDAHEAPIGGDTHQRLRDQQRDDLRVGQAAPGVLLAARQKIVGGAEPHREQQVEVGEHRGPPGSTARIGTADFDPLSVIPPRPQAVESPI
jgi:hypothetical protein